MKILAFADVHADTEAIAALAERIADDKPDLLISAGDLHNFGSPPDGLLPVLSDSRLPFLYVSGNHDKSEQQMPFLEQLRSLPGAVDLDENMTVAGEARIFGIGGTDCGIVKILRGHTRNWVRLIDRDKKVLWRLRKLRSLLATAEGAELPQVMVSHEPPRGYGDFGNWELDMFVRERGVKLMICGHAHENVGSRIVGGDCLAVNPGPRGMLLEVGRKGVALLACGTETGANTL